MQQATHAGGMGANIPMPGPRGQQQPQLPVARQPSQPRQTSTQRIEELEIGLAAAHEVNSHLNQEVERLTLKVEALEAERATFHAHIKQLSKQLAAARGAAAGAAGEDAAASGKQQQQRQAGAALWQKNPAYSSTDGRLEAPSAAAAEEDEQQQQRASDAGGTPPPATTQPAMPTPSGPDSGDGGGGDASSWLSQVDWEESRRQGRQQGWLISSEEVVLGEKIGQGTFGSVYRSLFRGGVVAVKCVTPKSADEGTSFCREVEALAMVRHPNVMSLYAACVEPPERCWIVCEYLPGGTLAHWLYGMPSARKPPPRPLSERLRVGLEVARGMEALEEHDPQVLHRDLKPSNVFLDALGHAKVADFGLSRILTPAAMSGLTGETGSYLWMSPECIRHELYNSRSDVWSWGVLCVELLTQQRPYSQHYATPVQIALQVAEGRLSPAVPADCHPLVAELLQACFEQDPFQRPSFGIIVSQLTHVVEEVSREESLLASGGGGTGAALVQGMSRWFKQHTAKA